ncbi:MAG TPA: C4-type zinc ribbon domain-containing protein [Bacteroidia bacterium]
MAKATLSEREKIDASVENKLSSLYELQVIDSKIDKIRTVRGELPLEIKDLEDGVEALATRLEKMQEETRASETIIADKKNLMKDAESMIKKYKSQQNKVRNNREYESLTKEIEYQTLEIQLAERKIKEFKAAIATKKEQVEQAEADLKERKARLKEKQGELDEIIAETEKEETAFLKKSKAAEEKIEERLLSAYKRIRANTRNGLAVVPVERDACGGCFSKIPPQRQLDIKMHKKLIVCEHCGRVLVAPDIAEKIVAKA